MLDNFQKVITQKKEIKPKTIKVGSLPRKQIKIISENNKKFLENVTAGGLADLK